MALRTPREVRIVIRPDGRVEVETAGFVGKSCAELSAFLEKALAGESPDKDDVQRDYQPEYYLAEQTQELGLEDRNA